jgi:DNA-directed RNA polymerase delta subunit
MNSDANLYKTLIRLNPFLTRPLSEWALPLWYQKQEIMDAMIKMDTFLVVLEFLGGILLVLALGWGLGKLFKLDTFDEELQTTSKKKKSSER